MSRGGPAGRTDRPVRAQARVVEGIGICDAGRGEARVRKARQECPVVDALMRRSRFPRFEPPFRQFRGQRRSARLFAEPWGGSLYLEVSRSCKGVSVRQALRRDPPAERVVISG
jgi:hypothetical protein